MIIANDPEMALHAVVQPGQLILGIGGIDRHQIKPGILQGDHPAFLVMFLHSDAV